LALKQFPPAEEAFRKASSIAPLDLQLLLALTYAEFANKDYPATIATATLVHRGKHQGAALVHFFAAAAFEAQNKVAEAEDEMKLLLREDPKAPSAEDFRKILAGLKEAERHAAQLKFNPVEKVTYSIGVPAGPGPEITGRMASWHSRIWRRRNRLTKPIRNRTRFAVTAGWRLRRTSVPRPKSWRDNSALQSSGRAWMKCPFYLLRQTTADR
jgi:tetratricopeptide (TPR) repeat protein